MTSTSKMSFFNKEFKNAYDMFVPGQSKSATAIIAQPTAKSQNTVHSVSPAKSEEAPAKKSGRMTKKEQLEKKKAMASAQVAELVESNPSKKDISEFIKMRIDQLLAESE